MKDEVEEELLSIRGGVAVFCRVPEQVRAAGFPTRRRVPGCCGKFSNGSITSRKRAASCMYAC